jgi:hypothetical protein
MAVSRILSVRRGGQDDHLSSSPSFVGELILAFTSATKLELDPAPFSTV